MKKSILLTSLILTTSVPLMAQNDLYFFTDKSEMESKVEDITSEKPTYYCGSDRDVDEYNRRGKLSSYYQKIGEDSLGNDIIEFHVGDGSYSDMVSPDTIYPGSGTYYADDNDFEYSRRLSHFDCWYGWYPYHYGYWAPWRYHYGWYDPWYTGYWGYGYGWYDWAFGWGYPYYHHWWSRPVVYRGGHTGTLGYYDRGYHRRSYGNSGTRYNGNSTNRNINRSNTGFGTRRNSTYNNNTYNNMNRGNSSFGGFRGSSFGGSRGGSFGGGSRGGGGRIGGRR